jgi:hypothetical protein
MAASGVFCWCAATFLIGANLPAQSVPSAMMQRLLPPDAKIIETANLNLRPAKARALVLWTRKPKRVEWRDEGYSCLQQVYGDHWLGPTRLSLVDLEKEALVNTVDVRSSDPLPNGKQDVFAIPYFVSSSHYHVARPDAAGQGQPTILNLSDMTGEGVLGQFVLFEYVASTSVFGYSPKSDRAVQYAIKILEGRKSPETQRWVMEIFDFKPIRPGRWDFTWEPGHGFDGTIHERVSFDKARQIFIDRRTVVPYPAVLK